VSDAAGPLVIIQPALPEFRVEYFAALAAGWPAPVVVAHGADLPGGVPNDRREAPYRRVELPWRPGRFGPQLAWAGVAQVVDRAGVLLVSGDLNQFAVHRLLALRWQGRLPPLAALSQFRRADASWLTSTLKPWWHRAFDGLILYTEREAEHYRRLGHSAKTLTWLNNGLSRVPPAPGIEALHARCAAAPLVCLGRHITKNRFDLALRGFAAYRAAGGHRRLVVIGTGPESDALHRLAEPLGAAVEFAGAVYDPAALDRCLSGAYAVIHPLAMGLSINTAFGYALPVVACADAHRHMPEFWIWSEGQTGFGFSAPIAQEQLAVPGIAQCLQRLDALTPERYVAMCLNAHTAVTPLTTAAMAERSLGLLRRLGRLAP